MTNKLSALLTLTLMLVFFGSHLQAQTKDSSSAEIKKQAMEMREKLNKYMADRLMVDEVKKDTGIRLFFDSISTRLYTQQEEIDKLKEQFNRLEQAIIKGETYNGVNLNGSLKGSGGTNGRTSRGGNPGAYSTEDDVAINQQGFQRYGERQLNLYFAFDSYKLSKQQKDAIHAFLKGKTITKRVTVNGFTDWMGTEKYNAALAENRCNALIKRLNILKLHYKTSTRFKCDTGNDYTPEKAKWCRRVELIIN